MKELQVALKAAAAASKIILRYYGKRFQIRHKGEINLVTEVDEKSQKAIVKVIKSYFKSDAILAEEGDLSSTARAPRRWIVDPIDGTTNFAHGYPRFCVSIAFEHESEVQCGVILDPLLKETFHAIRGKGAFLNKKRICVSSARSLKSSMLITGFPYDLEREDYNNVPYFNHMLKKVTCIRRDGSAAIDLAYVAAGRCDGFWELGLSPWDIAAGVLLVEEAGGIVRHMSGRKFQLEDHALIASNHQIFDELLFELSSTKKA